MSEPIIEITPTAHAELIKLRDAEEDAASLGLRLEIVSGPGEEFKYDLSLDEFRKAAFSDEVRTHDGLKVIVPAKDVELLQGAVLDFTSSGGLVIRNPNRPQAPMVEGLVKDDELSAEIESVIAVDVNPALAAHGGFVTYVGHDGDGTAFSHYGRRVPRLLHEPYDHARRCADHRGGEGSCHLARARPHRPHVG